MGVIDFEDVQQVRDWVAVCPERHVPVLRALYKLWPHCRHSIREAMK
jgi:hypothetical protein